MTSDEERIAAIMAQAEANRRAAKKGERPNSNPSDDVLNLDDAIDAAVNRLGDK